MPKLSLTPIDEKRIQKELNRKMTKGYWDLVRLSLIEIFAYSKQAATQAVYEEVQYLLEGDLEYRIKDRLGFLDIFYNEEAFDVALRMVYKEKFEDIRRDDDFCRDYFDKYLEIMDRLEHQWRKRSEGQKKRRQSKN
jgi:hypothetical protein